MRRWIAPLLALAIVLAAGTGYYVMVIRAPAGPEPGGGESVTPVATVTLVPLQRKTIGETLTTYATVVAALGGTETYSVPFESRVRRIAVTPGQAVGRGEALAVVEPSPDTLLELQQAQGEHASAVSQLDLVKQRVSLRLATESDLVAAQQRVDAAQLRLDSMRSRGIADASTTFTAGGDVLVSRIDSQPGAIVAAGASILEAVRRDQIVVRVGVEPADLPRVAPGQPVELVRLDGAPGPPLVGHIHFITQAVNPETRLIDVFVEPPPDAPLLLNEYVVARIPVASADALVLPRQAVIPEQGSHVVYTVEDGVAHRHTVSIGIESDAEIQVISPDLREGQQVAVTGNAELAEGMRVTTEPAP